MIGEIFVSRSLDVDYIFTVVNEDTANYYSQECLVVPLYKTGLGVPREMKLKFFRGTCQIPSPFEMEFYKEKIEPEFKPGDIVSVKPPGFIKGQYILGEVQGRTTSNNLIYIILRRGSVNAYSKKIEDAINSSGYNQNFLLLDICKHATEDEITFYESLNGV